MATASTAASPPATPRTALRETPGPRRRFFSVYQYLVPLTLFPTSYWLWLRRLDGDHAQAVLALSVPVVFGYVVPALGTNWLGLWEINTRLRLGRFRPHHGFVFGTAASLFALACLPPPMRNGVLDCLRAGVVVGSVLGFWNWLYDTYAIKSGFIIIHNRLAVEGHAAEVVATDHAPVLFGVFGLCYGVVLRAAERWVAPGQWTTYWVLLVAGNLAGLLLPVLAYVTVSYLRWGESGLRVYRKPMTGGSP
jgi:hypothetical protein